MSFCIIHLNLIHLNKRQWTSSLPSPCHVPWRKLIVLICFLCRLPVVRVRWGGEFNYPGPTWSLSCLQYHWSWYPSGSPPGIACCSSSFSKDTFGDGSKEVKPKALCHKLAVHEATWREFISTSYESSGCQLYPFVYLSFGSNEIVWQDRRSAVPSSQRLWEWMGNINFHKTEWLWVQKPTEINDIPSLIVDKLILPGLKWFIIGVT